MYVLYCFLRREVWNYGVNFLVASRLTTGICVFPFSYFVLRLPPLLGDTFNSFCPEYFLPPYPYLLSTILHGTIALIQYSIPFIPRTASSIDPFRPLFHGSPPHRIPRWDQNVQLFQKLLHL